MSSAIPGWPDVVPPPGVQGWESRAATWLLDHCPPDYRSYAGWRRHPQALAWIAVRHLDAQLAAMRGAWRDIRPELGEVLDPRAMTQVLAHLEAEGLRLRASHRAAVLIWEALSGKEYVPRL